MQINSLTYLLTLPYLTLFSSTLNYLYLRQIHAFLGMLISAITHQLTSHGHRLVSFCDSNRCKVAKQSCCLRTFIEYIAYARRRECSTIIKYSNKNTTKNYTLRWKDNKGCVKCRLKHKHKQIIVQIQYNTKQICIAPLVTSESEALGDSV